MQDSKYGLNNKEIDKLVKTYHMTSLTFKELHILLTNFRGMVLFTSVIAMALQACITFFACGNLVAQFQSMVAADPMLPACMGWFIECWIQAHLLSCGANTDPTTNISKLSFNSLLLLALDDWHNYGLCLCVLLCNLMSATAGKERMIVFSFIVAWGGAPIKWPSTASSSLPTNNPIIGLPSSTTLIPAPSPTCAENIT